jgi:hypothetical protein
MLLVSELGASGKNVDKRGENFILDLCSSGEGDHFDHTCPKTVFLDESSFEKVEELFHRVTPVRSALKSADGLGAVDSRKRPDFWGQVITLHTECVATCRSFHDR